MKKYLRYLIQIGILLGLVMPFVYTPSTTFPFVFGKAIFFCILVEVITVLYVALAVFSPKDRPHRSLLLYVLLAYMGALLLSTIFGVDPVRSFWGNHERMSGSFVILHFFLYFLVARSVLKTKKDWTVVFGTFLVSTVIMSVLAIIEHFSAKGLFADAPGGRVWGTLGNYIYLGVFMLFGVYIASYLAIQNRLLFIRIPLIAIALLDTYVLFLTESRASLLTLIVSLFVIACIAGLSAKGKTRKMVIGASVGFFVLLGFLFLGRNTPIVHSIPAVGRLMSTTLSGGGDRTRIIAWEIALQAWQNKPVFGWGPENFYTAFNLYYRPESLRYSYYETWFDRAHNSFLDAMAMTGSVGALLYLSVFVTAGVTVARSVKRNRLTVVEGTLFVLLIGAYFLQNLFAFDALSGFLILFLLLAFLDQQNDNSLEEKSVFVIPQTLGSVVVAIVAIFFGYFVLVNMHTWQANRKNLDAIAALRYGNFAEALTIHAAALAYGSPHVMELRSDFARDAGQIFGHVPTGKEQDATHVLQTAISETQQNIKEGSDVYDSIVLAQIYIQTNDPKYLAQAEQVLKAAIPLSPKRQQLLFTLARDYLLEGKNTEAVQVLQGVVKDEPLVAESHWLLSVALYQDKQEAASWQEMQVALREGYVWRSSEEVRLLLLVGNKQTMPADAAILAGYAEAEASTGATSTAREHMQKAVSLDPSYQDRATALYQKIGTPTVK